MQVTVLEEAGHELAIMGMAYSYKDRQLDVSEWWGGQFVKALKRSVKLSGMDGGHNKFLESIVVWIDIEASRAFWSEFDTYRVGTTKQSESTMHTLAKRGPVADDFEEGTDPRMVEQFYQIWMGAKGDINTLKMNLPEGFLQRRLVCTNYKVLRNIIAQREGHRLKWWGVFIEAVKAQVRFPEYLK